MSNLYRGPTIDASYQVLINLAKRFHRRRFFKNRSIRNKNCLWRPSFLMDRDKMSNLYRGPPIDASYQVSVHFTEGFQRRRLKREKLTDRRQTTDDRRRTPSDGKSSHCLQQSELKSLKFDTNGSSNNLVLRITKQSRAKIVKLGAIMWKGMHVLNI